MHTQASSPSRWALGMAYAASSWAFLFAFLSFFWAAGGHTGLHPFELEGMKDPILYVTNLAAGILKVAAGLLVLALVQSWGKRVPQWLLVAASGVASAIFTLHGLYSILGDVLVVTGVVPIPEPMNWKWRLLDLSLWGPWWLLGGILFALALWLIRRHSRPVRASHEQGCGSHL
ncbi:MAG: DUF3995 domain-containing protein [Ktedonobacteraceae bacterium]|nr:DUF3995 domain-containing protein [Ktedonobacteraceae bacterium]